MSAESPSSASTPSLPPRPDADFPPKAAPNAKLPRPAPRIKRPVPKEGNAPPRPASKPAAAANTTAPEPAIPARPQPAAKEPAPPSTSSADDHDDDDNRGGLSDWLRTAPAWLVSMLFHMVLILSLALMTLSSEKVREELSMIVNPSEELEPLEEDVAELDVEVDIDAEDVTESLQVSDLQAFEPDVNAVAETIGVEDSPAEATLDAQIDVAGPGMESLMEAIPGGGSELARMGKVTKFFGTESSGSRIVFVVDNSNSMGQGKLETALIEMYKAIEQLNEDQRFYIVFYSDTAYGLFHPSTEPRMVHATKANKARVRAWLGTIEMCLRTDAQEAIDLALKQYPDLMYLLGDGAIFDNADKRLANNPTLGMNVKPQDAERFKAVADAHNGTYRDVGVTDEGKALLKRDGPRPKNNERGPIWGIKLPVKKK